MEHYEIAGNTLKADEKPQNFSFRQGGYILHLARYHDSLDFAIFIRMGGRVHYVYTAHERYEDPKRYGSTHDSVILTPRAGITPHPTEEAAWLALKDKAEAFLRDYFIGLGKWLAWAAQGEDATA